MLLYEDSTAEDLFYGAPAGSKFCLFFCQHFLRRSHESNEDNSKHNLAGMADQADGTIAVTLLDVTFLW